MPAHKPFFSLFALDMQSVLNEQIVTAFEGLEPTPLIEANLKKLRKHEVLNPKAKKGLYVLHYDGKPVYAGKAENVLSKRLDEHLYKLSGRVNVDSSKVGFRCLCLDVNWSALAHEKPLLTKLKCAWNSGGFGNHDFGRGRDKTVLKGNHFDRAFPINTAIHINDTVAGSQTVLQAIKWMQGSLPYLFRVHTDIKKKMLPIYTTTKITVAASETVESLMGKIVDKLGAEWQGTFLCGYAILYKENTDYPPSSFIKFKRGGSPWVTP